MNFKNRFTRTVNTMCNKMMECRVVRCCVMTVLSMVLGVTHAFAEAAGGAGYAAGKNAISEASEQIAQYVPIATKLCYAIAGVVAIVGAISVYVKMNNEEQDVKKSIMMIIGACVFLIAAAQALPLFFGIEDGVITGF